MHLNLILLLNSDSQCTVGRPTLHNYSLTFSLDLSALETETDDIQLIFSARLSNRTKAIFHSFILILTTNSIIASTRVWGVTSAPRTC